MSSIEDIRNEREALNFLAEQASNQNKSANRLYHYTTFENLLLMISKRAFRLTRTDLLNDKAEQKIGQKDRAKHNYIMSMTEGTEYISMWAMYGRPSGLKIRLDFSKQEFLKLITPFKDWSQYATDVIHELEVNDNGFLSKPQYVTDALFFNDELDPIQFAYVAYISNTKANGKVLRFKNKKFQSLPINEKSIDLLTGFVKYDAWEFEKEIRLLVYLKANERDHIYLPITEDLIQTFRITFNPWISPEMKNVIKMQLKDVCLKELECHDSSHDGEVDETRIYL